MEKPLFASQQSMRLITQFRSFTTSAATRITASSLQQRDAQTLFGIVAMIGFGAISCAVHQQLAGREVSDDWATILKEGVDRSGMLSVFGDAHNVLEKTTGLGVSMAIGGPQSYRYYSRNTIGALLGPTAGMVGDIAMALCMARAVGDDDLAPLQVRALRRLAPLQNLFWLRWAFDHLQEERREGVGVEVCLGGNLGQRYAALDLVLRHQKSKTTAAILAILHQGQMSGPMLIPRPSVVHSRRKK